MTLHRLDSSGLWQSLRCPLNDIDKTFRVPKKRVTHRQIATAIIYGDSSVWHSPYKPYIKTNIYIIVPGNVSAALSNELGLCSTKIQIDYISLFRLLGGSIAKLRVLCSPLQ